MESGQCGSTRFDGCATGICALQRQRAGGFRIIPVEADHDADFGHADIHT